MPNLPTSLILVLLALAWLVVLVPMFARSREAVPETDDNAAGFRVLRRAGAALRRPAMRRQQYLDDDGDAVVGDAVVHGTADRQPDADLRSGGEDAGLVEELVDGEDDDRDDGDRVDDVDDDQSDDLAKVAVGRASAEHQLDAADEWAAEHQRVPVRTTSHARPYAPDPRSVRRDSALPAKPMPVAPTPNRRGRGGFDPEQAAATAAYRYRRRRFVTLLLAVLTLGLAAGAAMISSALWIGVTLAALTLVGYLVYLSRQVRIERAISERRMARLRRAEEIRPMRRREPVPVSPYQSEQRTPRNGPVGRPAAAQQAAGSSAAAQQRVTLSQRRAGVVDLDDDDPAFDDLEYYEPIVYRRAAGQ